ncbi:MAG: sugar ABC transporter permease [Alphaproteobacteria bacterium]|nr:sugar ABC transporter permease [Alphaproteobacteria bacterium]
MRGLLGAIGVDARVFAMIAALLVIWLGFHLLTDGLFLTPRNLWNLAVQTSVVGILATGMVLVIVARHIDLSVGSVLGFIGMTAAVFQVTLFEPGVWWNTPATILIALAAGAAIGAFQGYWVAYRLVPAFIVTLAGLLMFRGGAWLLTSGRTLAPMEPNFQVLGGGITGAIGAPASWVLGLLASAVMVIAAWRARTRRQRFGFPVRPVWGEAVRLGLWVSVILGFVATMNAYPQPRTGIPMGIPVPVLILIAIVLVMEAMTRTTAFGRYIYAMGGNPEAARLSGVDTRKVTLLLFVLMGVLAAIAGIIATARLNAGANATGELAELSVIAAAVIGGTSLAGGVGTIAGAILGAVIMQSLQNGMVLMGLPSALQNVIIGAVLILAVWLDVSYRRRLKGGGA